jgi:2-octaprenylphenol hydroxylase
MPEQCVDVTVVGNGVIGLATALALVNVGVSVAIVGKDLPTEPIANDRAMVYAINHRSQRWLHELGVWSNLSRSACVPYVGMEVWDAYTGVTIPFDASQVGRSHLGHMVRVSTLRWCLWQQLQQSALASVFCPNVAVALHRDNLPLLTLRDGTCLRSKLLVAADGRQSWVATQCQQPVTEWSCHQTALVAMVDSEQPHQQIARQAFTSTGPLALLPIDTGHRHAMVWSLDEVQLSSLSLNDPVSIAQQVQVSVASCLGGMTVVSPVMSLPLHVRQLKHYWSSQVAFVGDAAHSIHPLAGQGANLGLHDAEVLCQLLLASAAQGGALGSDRLLQRYDRQRRAANWRMCLACDGLQKIFAHTSTPMAQCRAWGMQGVALSGWVRRKMMQHAMGI